MRKVTEDLNVLMDQAVATSERYLRKAVDSIDKQFGPGYASKNPELVGAFIKVCAMDLDTALKTAAREDIVESLDGIASVLDGR